MSEFATGSRHFVDPQGAYLGSFVGVEPPEGSVQVDSEPPMIGMTWEGNAWVGMDDERARQSNMAELLTLENSITPRRLREAILSDTGAKWLSDTDNKIKTLRKKL